MNDKDHWQKKPHHQMLRSEYACDDEWIIDFLMHSQFGHVATRKGEQPFITPVVYWYDPETHEIYFHTNVVGRLRANSDLQDDVCFAVSRAGDLLPSNIALEFSIQYESVIIFGHLRLVQDDEEQRRTLYGLIQKYFPDKRPGVEYRPISELELKRTSVFAITIDSWSGKRNWHKQADQSPDWTPLDDPRSIPWNSKSK